MRIMRLDIRASGASVKSLAKKLPSQLVIALIAIFEFSKGPMQVNISLWIVGASICTHSADKRCLRRKSPGGLGGSDGAQALIVLSTVPKGLAPAVSRAVATAVRTAASPLADHRAR